MGKDGAPEGCVVLQRRLRAGRESEGCGGDIALEVHSTDRARGGGEVDARDRLSAGHETERKRQHAALERGPPPFSANPSGGEKGPPPATQNTNEKRRRRRNVQETIW